MELALSFKWASFLIYYMGRRSEINPDLTLCENSTPNTRASTQIEKRGGTESYLNNIKIFVVAVIYFYTFILFTF